MKQRYKRLIAIDPSLISSGWALFDIHSEKLIAVGTIKSKYEKNKYFERIANLQNKINLLIEDLNICSTDLMIVETATTIKDPDATLKVEQVRTIFETLARLKGALVPGRINPRSVQYEILGLKGKQIDRESVKAAAISVAAKIFSSDLERLDYSIDALSKEQDIVDAMLLGSLALVRINQANVASNSIEECFFNTKSKSNKRWSEASLNGLNIKNS